jgi:hypothetical protein
MNMIHIGTAQASAPSSQESVGDTAPAKGDPFIIAQLLRALSYRRQLPAFSRGQMVWDFDLGKVRIADARDPAA